MLLWKAPISTGEFLLGACYSCPRVLALDVESEWFYRFPCPAAQNEYSEMSYVARGRYLSCLGLIKPTTWLERYGVLPGTWWEVCELSDPMMGEWRKLCKIDLESQHDCGLASCLRVCSVLDPLLGWIMDKGWSLSCIQRQNTFRFGNQDRHERYYSWRDYTYSLVSSTPALWNYPSLWVIV